MHRRCVRSLNTIDFNYPGCRTHPALTHSRRQQYSSTKSRNLRSLSPEEEALSDKVAKLIVDRAARGPGKGWSYTKTLRGDEKRLTGSIQKLNQPERFPSTQKTRFKTFSQLEGDYDEASSAIPTDATVEPPGTFLELRRFVHSLVPDVFAQVYSGTTC